MRRYAERTSVPVERSKQDIERLLQSIKASSIATLAEADRAAIAFKVNGRAYRFIVPIPTADDFAKAPNRHVYRSIDQRQRMREQAVRQRWRALMLVLKAKLEAARSGITALDVELLPYAILPSGKSVADEALPALARAYADGHDVPLLPGPQ